MFAEGPGSTPFGPPSATGKDSDMTNEQQTAVVGPETGIAVASVRI